TFLLIDEATATKVPQTGSFLSSPPDCSLGAGGLTGLSGLGVNARITSRVTCRMKTAAMKTRKSRKIFRTMARAEWPELLFLRGAFLGGRILVLGVDLPAQRSQHPLGGFGI